MYIAYSQPKGADVWAALRKGFDAPEADPSWTPGRQRPLYRNGTAILGGLDFDQPALLREARQVGHPYLFVDAGYIATHINGKRARYRVVPGAYNHHWWTDEQTDYGRLRALGITLEPWRKTGREVLVCTSSDTHSEFFGLKAWADTVAAELRSYTDRPVIVRRKGGGVPFAEALKTAWAVVAWSSATAIEAALAGVPVFVGPESAALPMNAGHLSDIEAPRLSHLRDDWAAWLACCQFTVDEIASGMARAHVTPWLSARYSKDA